jgi:hypothetical protein
MGNRRRFVGVVATAAVVLRCAAFGSEPNGSPGGPGDAGSEGSPGEDGTIAPPGSDDGSFFDVKAEGSPPATCASPAPNAKLVFVADQAEMAPTLALADDRCTNAANAAGHPGSFVAWLSTTADGAIDRVAKRPYRNADGAIVFPDAPGAVGASTLCRAIAQIDGGPPPDNLDVWTGTLVTGMHAPYHCQSWTINGNSAAGTIGRTGHTDGNWTNVGSTTCDKPARVYCFEE